MSDLSLHDKSHIILDKINAEINITNKKRRILTKFCQKIEENLIGKEHPQYNKDGTPKLDADNNQIILHDPPLDWDEIGLEDDAFQKKYDTLKKECDDILGEN